MNGSELVLGIALGALIVIVLLCVVHELGERAESAYRIRRARYRDHSRVPAIK